MKGFTFYEECFPDEGLPKSRWQGRGKVIALARAKNALGYYYAYVEDTLNERLSYVHDCYGATLDEIIGAARRIDEQTARKLHPSFFAEFEALVQQDKEREANAWNR